MIRKADTLGTFQIESRAQMAMLPRIKPRTFYDLVIEVAIVRPGPIQGDMVHPYLRRREGREPVDFPTPELERVLGKTLGVPLFQEQAMQVAMVCAGFSAGEADQLRRAMATFKHTGGVSKFRDKLIGGMIANGYTPDFAANTFKQLEGFGSYGFPESHAASFALIAYASSWMKCHHPDVFCAALLNSQPMGFYLPAQIVRDAISHGVEIRPVCINRSRWDCTLEPFGEDGHFAVRLGMRLVKGLANNDAAAIIAARGGDPFTSADDLWHRAGVPAASLVQLAEADAFRPSLGLARREALWALKGLHDDPLPLFAAASERERRTIVERVEPPVSLRPMMVGREVVEDYGHVGLTLREHPVAFLRASLARRRIVTCAEAMAARDGRWLEAAGLVLVRQRPGSAKGVMFVTMEDESGAANIVVWVKVFEKFRRTMLSASMLAVRGRIQREGEVVHLVANTVTDLSAELASVGNRDVAFPLPHGRGDKAHHGGPSHDPRSVPKGMRPRDLVDPTLKVESLRVKTRDFR
jgi:error-prone DNA polymerase